jgi:hypothetical protein
MKTGDYKYSIQVAAEELADERFGVEFYDLPEDQRDCIYEEARQKVIDDYLSIADR